MTTTTTWSPMLEQYFGMKHRYPEAILLSRVGDFYEAYGDDAETIARALSIALTSKEAGGGRRVAMAGVPHHALDGYLAKLVAQRRVVALAEQLEAPVPNKLVRRDVVRVVTPGTLLEEHILEKPRDQADALRMLRLLSGQEHQVITGICLRATDRKVIDAAVTKVRFVSMAERELAEYAASGEPMDKAGAYAIQGQASKFIDRIEGCYFNVVGLPVSLVYFHLKKLTK